MKTTKEHFKINWPLAMLCYEAWKRDSVCILPWGSWKKKGFYLRSNTLKCQIKVYISSTVNTDYILWHTRTNCVTLASKSTTLQSERYFMYINCTNFHYCPDSPIDPPKKSKVYDSFECLQYLRCITLVPKRMDGDKHSLFCPT